MGARRHAVTIFIVSLAATLLGMFVGSHGEIRMLQGKPLIDDRISGQRSAPELPPLSPRALQLYTSLGEGEGGVAVLAYHGVSEQPKDRFDVTPDQLARHMRMLKAAGFRSITIEQFENYVIAGRPIPKRSVVIVFDDGVTSQWTRADRILEQYGMKATVALITSRLGSVNGFLTWQELNEMRKSGRWSVAGHTHEGHRRIPTTSGKDLPFLLNRELFLDGTRETRRDFTERIGWDLITNRRSFSNRGIAPPGTFVFPFSAVTGPTDDPKAPSIARRAIDEAGFRLSLATADRPKWVAPGDGPFELPRFGVYRDTTAVDLFRVLQNSMPRSPKQLRRPLATPGLWQPATKAVTGLGTRFDAGSLDFQAPEGEWRGAYLGATADAWRDYTVRTTISGLNPGGPGESASLLLRAGRTGRVEVAVSATQVGLRVRRAGKTRVLAVKKLPASTTRNVKVVATGRALKVVVDGVRLSGRLTPREATLRGGVGAGVWRRDRASGHPRFGAMRVGAVA